jgi:hypothetical protein
MLSGNYTATLLMYDLMLWCHNEQRKHSRALLMYIPQTNANRQYPSQIYLTDDLPQRVQICPSATIAKGSINMRLLRQW